MSSGNQLDWNKRGAGAPVATERYCSNCQKHGHLCPAQRGYHLCVFCEDKVPCPVMQREAKAKGEPITMKESKADGTSPRTICKALGCGRRLRSDNQIGYCPSHRRLAKQATSPTPKSAAVPGEDLRTSDFSQVSARSSPCAAATTPPSDVRATPAEIEAFFRSGAPVIKVENHRTLWRATLRLRDGKKEEFLFRSTSEFERASATAVLLLQASPGAEMTGAEIFGIEAVGHLWN